MSARPVYHSPITVSSGGESPRRTGSRGVRGRFTYGYGNRSRAANAGFNYGDSSRMDPGSGLFRMGPGYSGSERGDSGAPASRSHPHSHSYISISSDDSLDAPDAHLLAELSEIKQGLVRVEDRIEGLS